MKSNDYSTLNFVVESLVYLALVPVLASVGFHLLGSCRVIYLILSIIGIIVLTRIVIGTVAFINKKELAYQYLWTIFLNVSIPVFLIIVCCMAYSSHTLNKNAILSYAFLTFLLSLFAISSSIQTWRKYKAMNNT